MIRAESRSRSFELAAEHNETGERRSIVLTSTTESKADAFLDSEKQFPKGIDIKKMTRQDSTDEESRRRNSGVDHQRQKRRTSSRRYSQTISDEIEVKPAGLCSSICWAMHDALFGKCDLANDVPDVDFFG